MRLRRYRAPCRTQGTQRQRNIVDIRNDLAVLKPKGVAQLLLKFDAAGDRAFNEDADQSLIARPRDEPVGFRALDAEKLRNFALRLAASKMQPGSARRDGALLIQLQSARLKVQRFPFPLNFFS